MERHLLGQGAGDRQLLFGHACNGQKIQKMAQHHLVAQPRRWPSRSVLIKWLPCQLWAIACQAASTSTRINNQRLDVTLEVAVAVRGIAKVNVGLVQIKPQYLTNDGRRA